MYTTYRLKYSLIGKMGVFIGPLAHIANHAVHACMHLCTMAGDPSSKTQSAKYNRWWQVNTQDGSGGGGIHDLLIGWGGHGMAW